LCYLVGLLLLFLFEIFKFLIYKNYFFDYFFQFFFFFSKTVKDFLFILIKISFHST